MHVNHAMEIPLVKHDQLLQLLPIIHNTPLCLKNEPELRPNAKQISKYDPPANHLKVIASFVFGGTDRSIILNFSTIFILGETNSAINSSK